MAERQGPNLQQRWPEQEREMLRSRAEEVGVTETAYLMALVLRDAAEPARLDDFLPPPSPRSIRGKKLRAEWRAQAAEEKAREEAEREPRPNVKAGRPRKAEG